MTALESQGQLNWLLPCDSTVDHSRPKIGIKIPDPARKAGMEGNDSDGYTTAADKRKYTKKLQTIQIHNKCSLHVFLYYNHKNCCIIKYVRS